MGQKNGIGFRNADFVEIDEFDIDQPTDTLHRRMDRSFLVKSNEKSAETLRLC